MSKKILVCDDEPHIRMLLEQTLEDLEDEGVELLVGTNGQEGLNIILESRPDLVFLDVIGEPLRWWGRRFCHTRLLRR